MPTENKVFTKLFSDKKVELSMIEDMSYLALVLGGTTIDFEVQLEKVKK